MDIEGDGAEMKAHTRGSGQAVNIRMVGFDKPLFTALAVVLAVAGIIYAGIAEREARLAEYYGVDLEMYVAKQGLTPPPDPWGHRPLPTKGEHP